MQGDSDSLPARPRRGPLARLQGAAAPTSHRMGNSTRSRKKGFTSKKKHLFRAKATKRRTKDLDQIEDDLKRAGRLPGEIAMADADAADAAAVVPYDPDLPGGGRFYCPETARHFESQHALDQHMLSKQFKNQVKRLKMGAYTQDHAESARGVTKEILPPVSASS